MQCPVCGGLQFEKFLPEGRIGRESKYRERFILERFERQPNPSELKDLTDFAHGDNAAILACSACRVFVRDEKDPGDEQTYADDPYDDSQIDRLFPRYAQAFRNKAAPYRSLLQSGAKVLEIGSHYGAFLQVAGEWGWRAQGIDIGKDTSRYARSKGFTVFECELQDCAFPNASYDGVFVWNCFEQVPDPRPLLKEIHRVVKPGGLLVVRTPNAVFYELSESLLRDSGLLEERGGIEEFALKAMAYNNLLAFPYLYGYGSATLGRLISSEHFHSEGALDSELITLPLPEVPAWVAEEERAISLGIASMNRTARARADGPLTGPWIELYYRTRR